MLKNGLINFLLNLLIKNINILSLLSLKKYGTTLSLKEIYSLLFLITLKLSLKIGLKNMTFTTLDSLLLFILLAVILLSIHIFMLFFLLVVLRRTSHGKNLIFSHLSFLITLGNILSLEVFLTHTLNVKKPKTLFLFATKKTFSLI